MLSKCWNENKLSLTSGSQFFDYSMVLCLWKRRSVIIGVTHHHSQLHWLGNLSAIWTLDHNADQKLSQQEKQRMMDGGEYKRKLLSELK